MVNLGVIWMMRFGSRIDNFEVCFLVILLNI